MGNHLKQDKKFLIQFNTEYAKVVKVKTKINQGLLRLKITAFKELKTYEKKKFLIFFFVKDQFSLNICKKKTKTN